MLLPVVTLQMVGGSEDLLSFVVLEVYVHWLFFTLDHDSVLCCKIRLLFFLGSWQLLGLLKLQRCWNFSVV